MLALYAVLVKEISVFDTGVLYNKPLRMLLCDPAFNNLGYRNLLEKRIVVPRLRDTVLNFRELEEYLRESSTYRPVGASVAVPYAEFLDGLKFKRERYSNDDFYDRYTRAVDGFLLNPDLLPDSVRPVAADLSSFMQRAREGSKDGHIRRSVLYGYAQGLQDDRPDVAAAVRDLATVLYHAAYSAQFKALPVYPATLGKIQDRIYGFDAHSAGESLEVLSQHRLDLPLTALSSVGYDVIQDIRGSRPFNKFVKAQRRIGALTDPQIAAAEFESALLAYLDYLREPLTLALGGQAKSMRRLDRITSVARVTSLGGAVAITVTGAAVSVLGIPFAALGLAWMMGGFAADWGLKHAREERVEKARRWVDHEVRRTDTRFTIARADSPRRLART